MAAGVVVLLGCTALLWSRLDTLHPAGNPDLTASVKALAQGRVVLADEPLVESLAAEGVRIWLSNPIDAFDQADQAAYLDFVSGASDRELAGPPERFRGGRRPPGGPADGPCRRTVGSPP